MLARAYWAVISVSLLWVAGAGWAELQAAQPSRDAGREVRGTVVVDGRRRAYWLHVPPIYDGRRRLPVVVVLHGHGGHPTRIRRVSGMDAKADREGFLVVYPQGTGWLGLPPRSWNAGHCCGYAKGKQVDDVAFARALLTALEREYAVDPQRIYVTGVSNGAMMAHRLGCELADRIAAIAPVAGALGVEACSPSGPVAVLIFHGTADEYVLYDGGASPAARDGRVDPPVSAAVAAWVSRNGCHPEPVRNRSGSIEQERYTDGAQGSEVTVYTIRGGGHAWPGGTGGRGPHPDEFSATDRMWEFFARHPKRSPAG